MSLKSLRCSKTLLSSFVSCVSHCPYLLLSVRHIGGFMYLNVQATIGAYRLILPSIEFVVLNSECNACLLSETNYHYH